MPKWWPWGRSKRPDPEPTAPAVRPDPAWHRLPAVQRTIGHIEPTAQLHGFTESLTTSQNPGLTGQLELLSAEHSDRLPVLDLVRHSTGASAHRAPAPAAPTPQSRTWAPSPMAVQRALFQSNATLQRTDDVAAAVREIHPAEAAGPTDAPPYSMVEAPPPDDRRILDVTNDPAIGTDERQSVDSVASQATSHQETSDVDGVSIRVTAEPVARSAHRAPSTTDAARAVQRVPSAMDSFPAAPEAVSATLPGSTGGSLSPPLRHLPSVQHSVIESRSAPEGFANARTIPVLRSIESSAGGQQPRSKLDATTTLAGDGGTMLQRSTDPCPADPVPADATAPPHPGPMPPSTRSSSASELPVMRTVDVREPATAPPPVTAQRITASTRELKPASRAERGSAPDASVTPSPVTGLQRLPVVDLGPTTPVAGIGAERNSAASPTVQRTPEWSTAMGSDVPVYTDEPQGVSIGWEHLPLAGEPPHPGFAGASEATQELTQDGKGEATRGWNGVPDEAAPQHAAAPTPPAGVVQRVSLPVVQPTPVPTRGESPPAPSHSDSPVTPAVQRSSSGRLVVLPPVRTSGDSTDDVRGNSQEEPQRSLVFESPRPVGLQRMFEQHTAKHPDRATDFRSAGSPSAGFTSAVFSSGSSYSGDSDSGAPSFEASGHSYDLSTNTVSFASPTIQRAPEDAPASPEPAPAPAPAPTMTSAPAAAGPAKTGGDVDELVNRIYDPLAARLRAELWLDRERAGVLMDLGR